MALEDMLNFLDFDSWIKRKSALEPRIHEGPTDEARVRLVTILKDKEITDYIDEAYRVLKQRTGKEIPSLERSSSFYGLKKWMKNTDRTDLYWSYLEILLNIAWQKSRMSPPNKMSMAHEIQRALQEEGILVELTPSAKKIAEYVEDQGRYHPFSQSQEYVNFQQVGDETLIEADQAVRTLALGETWEEPLKGYNEAWNLYKDDTITYVILEKLHNSLEGVIQKICSDLEGWEDDDTAVGSCIATMNEKGLFGSNSIIVDEWQKILSGLENITHQLQGDRKRHQRISQEYALLLLHQTSAFLTFIIKEYEKQYQ
jgi:hypothetical protein